jgi:hypothetical protein
LEQVPDEFYTWVQSTSDTLQTQFNAIEHSAMQVFDQVKDLPTRKEQAAIVRNHAHAAVIFSMLDRKPYADMIWKQLKPLAEKPFKEDKDA